MTSNILICLLKILGFEAKLNFPVFVLIKSLALDFDGCFYYLKGLNWACSIFCCVQEFSESRSGKSCLCPLLWPDSDWDMTAHLCERTSVCLSIFAHIHRLHFGAFP